SSKALLMSSPQPQIKTASNIVVRFCKIIRELCTCLTEQLNCQGGENLSVKDAGAASHFSKLSARSCRRWRKLPWQSQEKSALIASWSSSIQAFVSALTDAGVTDAKSRVFVSGIPIRS